MANCYDGPNPVKEEERYAIWKWAKENGIDQGMSYDQVHDAINQFFFGGQAKPAWITDILAGRKTPFRSVANDVWRKQYNRKAIVAQAKAVSEQAGLGPIGKFLHRLRFIPRSISVAGHGIVFPVTHAGDLLLRPQSWGTFIKGTARTYRAAFSSAYSAKVLNTIAKDPMYDMALRSGVDVGPKSAPAGLIETGGGKTGFFKAAARAWDMLTVMRFELWKKQVGKYLKPGMSEAEALDIGKNLADWANHATGSAKGPVASLGGEVLFGPKLTQSKLNRVTIDPVKTVKTFTNWKTATAGEKAAAWTRLSGATQYLVTSLGFLAVNEGLLRAFGSKQSVNLKDPSKGDWMAFKGEGLDGYVPGLHTEVRTLAKILAIWREQSTVPGKRKALVQNPALRGESKRSLTAKVLGEYAIGKVEPGIQRGLEIGTGQDWMGRPVPWSSDKGTEKKPRLTWGEYAGSVGPIPLDGPTGYVYDQLRKNGASASDSTAIIKALMIFGAGLPGFHVKEDYEAKKD